MGKIAVGDRTTSDFLLAFLLILLVGIWQETSEIMTTANVSNAAAATTLSTQLVRKSLKFQLHGSGELQILNIFNLEDLRCLYSFLCMCVCVMMFGLILICFVVFVVYRLLFMGTKKGEGKRLIWKGR